MLNQLTKYNLVYTAQKELKRLFKLHCVQMFNAAQQTKYPLDDFVNEDDVYDPKYMLTQHKDTEIPADHFNVTKEIIKLIKEKTNGQFIYELLDTDTSNEYSADWRTVDPQAQFK